MDRLFSVIARDKDLFKQLTEQWLISRCIEPRDSLPYQRIIQLAKSCHGSWMVKTILYDLVYNTNRNWIPALEEITGIDTDAIPKLDSSGNPSYNAINFWVNWGKRNGYLP